MKFGIVAIYQGKEFGIVEGYGESFELFTRNPQAETMGFVEDEDYPGVYTKIVNRQAIETGYKISNFVRYQGHDFAISTRSQFKEAENKILLIGADEEFDTEMTEPIINEKWINIDEAELIWEARKPIYGFQLPDRLKPLETIETK